MFIQHQMYHPYNHYDPYMYPLPNSQPQIPFYPMYWEMPNMNQPPIPFSNPYYPQNSCANLKLERESSLIKAQKTEEKLQRKETKEVKKKKSKKKQINLKLQEYIPRGLKTSTQKNRITSSYKWKKLDRNIESNAIKLFLKNLRTQSFKKGNLIEKIIQHYELTYKEEEFYETLNSQFDVSATYIRPSYLRNICHDKAQNREEENFKLVLRIALLKFFRETIHLLNLRSVRTTWKIRNEQIKAGRRLIDIMFEQ